MPHFRDPHRLHRRSVGGHSALPPSQAGCQLCWVQLRVFGSVVIAAVVKVWRPLRISRSLLRAWAIYFVNLGLDCLGVALSRRCRGLWDTRSVSISPFQSPVSRSRFTRLQGRISQSQVPVHSTVLISLCSFHCAHFIVLISAMAA